MSKTTAAAVKKTTSTTTTTTTTKTPMKTPTVAPPADWLNVPDLQLTDGKRLAAVNAILRPLRCTDAQYTRVADTFRSHMQAALLERPSSLQMENTYIPELPDGSENGVYLALDLGGTNFRTILLELRAGRVVRELVRPYHIPDEMRLGAGAALFDYLAACLVDFVVGIGLESTALPLGFTFSFPMHQQALDAGRLVTWTKSFNCSDVAGEDVVQLLRAALRRRGHNHIEVVAILNDTTGTLVQGASIDGRTRIGIVLGTGSNACYVERAERVQHWETERHGERSVIIDIEWGAFGDDGALDFVRTEFDRELDGRSLLVKSFTFEKYIGGKYLGELVRGILARLQTEGVFLLGGNTAGFPEAWAFNSDQVSEVEKDIVAGSRERSAAVLTQIGAVGDVTSADIAILQHVVAIVGLRAARLVAANTAVLLQQIRDDSGANGGAGNMKAPATVVTAKTVTPPLKARPKSVSMPAHLATTTAAAAAAAATVTTASVTTLSDFVQPQTPTGATPAAAGGVADGQTTVIAIDGSVYKHHPRLKGWLERYIALAAPDHQFALMLAEDGSGKGAGLAAAIAARLRDRC